MGLREYDPTLPVAAFAGSSASVFVIEALASEQVLSVASLDDGGAAAGDDVLS
jgi:hypothetical protein